MAVIAVMLSMILFGSSVGADSSCPATGVPRLHAGHWGMYGGDHGSMDLDITTFDLPIYPDGWAYGFFEDATSRQDWWDKVHQLRQEGKYQLVIIGLRGDYEERVAQLERMFTDADGVQTHVEDLVGVALGHEVTTRADELENRLYDYIKAHWPGLQVYKFYSQPLKPYPGFAQLVATVAGVPETPLGTPERCDGYLYDLYGDDPGGYPFVGGDADEFRRTVQKFVITGKPVVLIIWAAEPGWGGYFAADMVGHFEEGDITPMATSHDVEVQDGLIRQAPNSTLERYFWHGSNSLREFGLPVLVFGVAGPGSPTQWYFGGISFSPNLLYIKQNMAFRLRDEMRRAAYTGPQPSADYSWGLGVEVIDQDGQTVFDYGPQPSARQSNAEIPHRIVPGPYVDNFLPDDACIGLRTIDHATIRGFTRLLHTNHLAGRLVTRGSSDQAGAVELVYRFYSRDGALGEIRAEIIGSVRPKAGGVNSLALSTNGLVWPVEVHSSGSTAASETLTLQAPQDWPAVQEFYVRVRMTYDQSPAEAPANTLEKVTVHALVAHE